MNVTRTTSRVPAARAAASASPTGSSRAELLTELTTLRREQRELRQAIFEGAHLQRKLCAPRELRRGAFEAAGEIFPVRHLSGDFFKVFETKSGIGLALGDIAGKGISAGLWLPHLISLIRACAREHADPAAGMAAVNSALCEAGAERPLTALLLACIDTKTGELIYCNAGQPPALLLRQKGATESLLAGGPMLGAISEARFESGRVLLEPGDTLIAYSDGLLECRNAKDEEFGEQRITAAVSAAKTFAASQALFSTLGAALDFAGERSPGDDLSLLVVRRRLEAPRVLSVTSRSRVDFRGEGSPGVRAARHARQGLPLEQLG